MPVTPNSDPLGILTKEADPLGILEKKSQNGSNLSVGANGQLKESVPATLPSETQSKSQVVPDFGMASFSDLAKGQRSQAENTTATNAQDFEESVEEKATREQRAADREAAKKRKKDALPIALDDAAKRSLKIKGLNPNNKALLNKEKSKFALEIAAGNADVGFDKEGRAGLVTTPGFLESFHSSTMDAINFNKEAREFHKMNVAQRVEFVKRKQQEQEQKQNESQYVGERPTEAGSFGQVIGGATPALGLYGAGALAGGVLEAAAPATGGLSNLALKPVMSFVVNAGMGADHKAMENVLERYHAIKSKNPEIDDDAAMAEAGKGEDVDRLAGITESALFSKTGSNLNVGKSATGNILKGMAKAGIDIGGKIAITEGLADVGHNVEGVTNKSISDIAKDMFHAFEENAPMGAALHGFMTVLSGAAKVPGLIKSALKYDVVTKMKPEEIKSALDENVQRGAITPEEAEKASNELVQFTQVLNKTPAGLSEDAQASAAGLIIKRDNIKKESEGLDESANDMNSQEIDGINKQIKEIYRTDKPLEHEINPATGETFKKPTFDNVAAMRVKNLADKISKGKEISDPEDLQTQANFPQELEKQLQKVLREEKSANKGKEKPNNEISDNVNGYLKEQSNEAEKSKVPVITEKAGVADEGINKIEQPTEEIKKEEPVQSTVVEDKKVVLSSSEKQEIEKTINEHDHVSGTSIGSEGRYKTITTHAGKIDIEYTPEEVEAVNKIYQKLPTTIEGDTDTNWDKRQPLLVEVQNKVLKRFLDEGVKSAAVEKAIKPEPKQLPVTKEDAIKVAINNAGDVKSKIYQEVLKSGNESDISDVLKEVSDQWHDEGTRAQTERDFGKPIVDAAKELFPQESQKSLLPKETSIEEMNKQREAELKEIPKPDVKLDLISNKDLVNSKKPVETKLIHDKIKDGYKILKQMVDCL